MSDDEVEKFNRNHMVEIEMSDPLKIAQDEMNKASKEFLDEFVRRGKQTIPLNKREETIANMRYIEGWNAAIEAAAMKVGEIEDLDEVETRMEIRKLKK